MNNFRDHSPKRTCTKSYTNYRSYKEYLATDFSNRCGYTNCPDFWFGGKDNFHIDHFLPWKKYPAFPNLKTDYSNLVYSCSYVNISKSDDEGNYLDPCNEDYNKHFTRDKYGAILPNPKSNKAVYMHQKLKLYLGRYKTIWMLDKLESQMQELIKLKNLGLFKKEKHDEVNTLLSELLEVYLKYIQYLRGV